jgi:hypothetical protein
MSALMAISAERDQVFVRIFPGVAAKLFVMDFQVRHRSAQLASPGIATQHLLPKTLVGNWI